eukprot:466141_1
MGTSRYFIFQLYAKELCNNSTSTISTIIFAAFVWYAISTFTLTQLGDKWNHDKVFLIALTVQVIGLLFESFATNLTLLSIGFFITKTDLEAIAMAYITWILPHNIAVKYLSRLFIYESIAYLLGPIIAGICSQYLSYRSVFFVNLIIMICLTITALIFVYGSQKQLEEQQSKLTTIVTADEMFPISIRKTTETTWHALYYSMERTKIVFLALAILSNNICFCLETTMQIYFALWMKLHYQNIQMDVISLLLLSSFIPAGIAIFSTSHFIKRIIPKYVPMVGMCGSVFTICAIIFSMRNNTLNVYWIGLPLSGVAFGFIEMATEMCVLETQPKEHTGKINALKESNQALLRGLLIWIVGLWWEAPYYNSFWYCLAAYTLIIGIGSIPLTITARYISKEQL